MPPRYAYWTIIVDDQPTAFRAGTIEDLMPTFNRLKDKQPSAKLMWFQNGKLWPSRIDAREAMAIRGDRGRDRDPRQRSNGDTARPAWKPKSVAGRWSETPALGSRPEWKPRSASTSRPRAGRDQGSRPEWKPKGSDGTASSPRRGDSREKLDWKPKGSSSFTSQGPSPAEGKRKWVPKAEYKKATGTEAKRNNAWRPGGDHKDPRQKYKDAKKAKWTRFKQAIRTRASKKRDD